MKAEPKAASWESQKALKKAAKMVAKRASS
jgi:hypothetical protein